MAEDFYPFVENAGVPDDADIAKPLTAARIAVYDDMTSPPRVVMVAPTDIRTYLAEITKTTYDLVIQHCDRWSFQVVRELVENLIHAAFREPTVSVLDRGRTLVFSDQGPGIPDKRAVLRPSFSSATAGMKRYIRGVGSGLPIVEEWLRLHNGTLTIEDNLGCGTTVTVSLARGNSAGEQGQEYPGTYGDHRDGQVTYQGHQAQPQGQPQPAAAYQPQPAVPTQSQPQPGMYAPGYQPQPGPYGQAYPPQAGVSAGYPAYPVYPPHAAYPAYAMQMGMPTGYPGYQGAYAPYGVPGYQPEQGHIGIPGQPTTTAEQPWQSGQSPMNPSAPGYPMPTATSAGYPAVPQQQPNAPAAAEAAVQPAAPETQPDQQGSTERAAGIDAHVPLTAEQRDIVLLFAKVAKIGPKELNEHLSVAASTGSRRLKELEVAGYINKAGQKYVLTGEGQRVLAYLTDGEV